MVILSYAAVFLLTVIIYGVIQNSGASGGSLQEGGATFPLVYVQSGGTLINEMHGYSEEVDAGYLRSSITPLDESRIVNLIIEEKGYGIVSAGYKVFNDQNTVLLEEGDCSEIKKDTAGKGCQISFQNQLRSNCEYCLHIILKTGSGQELFYYTRLRFGSDLKVAEKLRFVLDFNEQTFSKDSIPALENYLESTGTSLQSDMSYVDIHSSPESVTWGRLSPSRISRVYPCLKEINTETAAFTLSYNIESAAGDFPTNYVVSEYYRIRLGDEKIYLLDFQRNMTEIQNLSEAAVRDGRIRLGSGDGSRSQLINYGLDDQKFACVCTQDSLWMYNLTDNILTQIYDSRQDDHGCRLGEDTAIKVIQADSDTGDIYFAVYGYMHEGRYEGHEGILVCRFSYQEDLLEELVFIPYHRGFELLREGLSTLSYMSGEDMIYFLIEDKIYRYTLANNHMDIAWDTGGGAACAVSDHGIVAMANETQQSPSAGENLRIIDLNNGRERKLDAGANLITPLGYVGTDLVYGIVDRSRVGEDSSGVIRVPVSEVHIADEKLRDIKVYMHPGGYIMRTRIEGSLISFSLGKPEKAGSYTDYKDEGSDYIVYNAGKETGGASFQTGQDSVKGLQYYLKLDSGTDLNPVIQSARQMDPGYDISKECELSPEPAVRYYVYTRGILAGDFSTLREAVDYGNEYAGTVMTSHKQIVWQRAGKAYLWDLGITEIPKARKGRQNQAIAEAVCSFEGWDLPEAVDQNQPLYTAMAGALPAEMINLTGMELTDVLHFVYRDRIVIARTGEDSYCLIIGYTADTLKLGDIESGEISTVSMNKAQEMFESAGNAFYSYYD